MSGGKGGGGGRGRGYGQGGRRGRQEDYHEYRGGGRQEDYNEYRGGGRQEDYRDFRGGGRQEDYHEYRRGGRQDYHNVGRGRRGGGGGGGGGDTTDRPENHKTAFPQEMLTRRPGALPLPPLPPHGPISLEECNVPPWQEGEQAAVDDACDYLLPFGSAELGAIFGRHPESLIAQVDLFAGADVVRTETNTRRESRPTRGSAGNTNKALTNHFVFKDYPSTEIFQYSVKINKIICPQNPQDAHYLKSTEVAGKGIRTFLLKEAQKNSGFKERLLAFDGAGTLYTAKELPFVEMSIRVTLPPDDQQGQERSFQVALRKASEPQISDLICFTHGNNPKLPQEVLQAFDIILRQTPRERYTSIGRFFYFSEAEGGLQRFDRWVEGRCGYIQSVRPIELGLSLNINVSSNAFYLEQSIIDFIKIQICEGCETDTSLNENQHMELEKHLRGLRVSANYNYGGGHHVPSSRVYLIDKLTKEKTSDLNFTKDGRKIMVVDYFAETYGIELKFLSLPCISTRGGKAYIPLEVIQTNDYNNDKYARDFKMNIRVTPCIVNTRVLETPKVQGGVTEDGEYMNTSRNRPNSCSWNMHKKKMLHVKKPTIWFKCINLSSVNDARANTFIDRLVHSFNNLGMTLRCRFNEALLSYRRPEVISRDDLRRDIFQRLEIPDLLIFLMPDRGNTTLYGHIKYLCDIEFGVISQCCLEKNVKKIDEQYNANLALKINIKFGGTNSAIPGAEILKEEDIKDNIIIFGADVTHPASRDRTTPSIAAVVASLNSPIMTNYVCALRTQESRQEIIQDLYKEGLNGDQGMILELIDAAKKRNTPPTRIIFYRDGVSEGQFSEVLQLEVNAIRQAYAQLQVNPSITFVVVQKRHQTRLFLKLNQVYSNVQPGTVVDTGICHPREYDFFLCSHYGSKGTSRPAHYHVLLDENNFTVDQLQGLTYQLCYSFQRCTKAISIVPPAFYAHLAAKRATLYLPKTEEAGQQQQQQPVIPPLPQVHQTVKEGMFFC